ncbi:MAG: class I SAM-dependent methyltransferase [Terriglobales bacterium]
MEDYFRELSTAESEPGRSERIRWRLSCFDQGLRYARYIETSYFPLEGAQVFDAACAWGGHALALAVLGARVFAADLNDHAFTALTRLSRQLELNLWAFQASCGSIPLAGRSCDVVLALELVEHIASVEGFAHEVARVLRPGGICLVSTPARIRSFVQGEPHYGIRGLTVLPLSWQRWVATRLWRRPYPYPIPRQYLRASDVVEPFASQGLSGLAVIQGRPLKYLQSHARWRRLAEELYWNFIVIKKPDA